jgi:hypothetical protein
VTSISFTAGMGWYWPLWRSNRLGW